MARTATGKGVRAIPVVTRGLTDRVWVQGGEARKADGMMFLVTGEAIRAPGLRELVSWTTNPFLSKPIVGLGRFQIPQGPDELVVAYDGKVDLVRRTGVQTILGSRYTPSQPVDGENFAANAGWLFITNGWDRNKKWNGRYVCDVGVWERPTPPMATALIDIAALAQNPLGSMDNAVAATFQYRRTFVNSSGHEGPPSDAGAAASTSLVAGSEFVAMIRGLALPGSQDLLWQNIYKRAADGFYYFWRQAAVNETVLYDYEVPWATASGGVPLTTDRQPPPTAKWVVFFRGRAYYAGNPDTPSLVWFSDSGFPEHLGLLSYLSTTTSDRDDVITGMVLFSDSIIVFKRRSMWQITSLADGTPLITPLSSGIGCVGPRAMAVVYGTLYFVGDDGIYSYDGSAPKPISDTLRRAWDQFDRDGLRNAVAFVSEARRVVGFVLPGGKGSLTETQLLWHYQLGSWLPSRSRPVTAAVQYKDETLVAVEKSDGQYEICIWGLSESLDLPAYTGTGDPDLGVVATGGTMSGRIRFGPYGPQDGWSSDEQQEVVGISVLFPCSGTHSLTVRWFADRNPVAVGSRTIALNQEGFKTFQAGNQDLTSLAGWGAKDWGQARWNGPQLLRQHLTLDEPLLCREIEVEFENGTKNQPWGIAGFVVWRTAKGSEAER